MSKKSRKRYWEEIYPRQVTANTQKALLPGASPTFPTPLLSEVKTVERNPFVPATVEPRGDARVKSHKDLTKDYVPSRTTGYYPFLQALPPYIDDLSQQFGVQVYDQMMTDPVVHSSLYIFILAILAGGQELTPSLSREEHDYKDAVFCRDFVQSNLDETETPYNIILEQHLNAMALGASVNEQVYYTEEMKYTRKQPQLRLKDIRDKPLINTIFVVDSFFNTAGILTQRFPGQNFPAGSYIPIDFSAIATPEKGKEFDLSDIIPGFLPRSTFSVLTNQMRYNDERGHSALRPAYQAWWFKQQTVAENLAFLSKYGSPSLVATTQPLAQPQTIVDANMNPVLNPDGSPLQKTPEQVLSDVVAQFQNGSAVAIPNGATIEAIEAQGNGEAFYKALNWSNREIAYAITYQALATQEGLHQARASSEVHQDILSLGILRRKMWLATQQRREVFKRLLMYNFDMTGKKIARYVPKLNLGLGDGFPMTPDSVSKLFTSGYFGQVPDPAQLETIDGLLGLPIRERQPNVQFNPAMMAQKPQTNKVPVAEEQPAIDEEDEDET